MPSVSGFGIDMYTLLYLKWSSKKVPIAQQRELCLMLCGNLNGRGVWGRMDACPFALHLKLSQHC